MVPPDPATRLDPNAREILDEYIRAREAKSFYRSLAVSVSSVLTALALLASGYLWVKEEAVTKSQLEAIKLFEQYKATFLDTELAAMREETKRQKDLFDEIRAEISASYLNITRTSEEIETLHEKAQSALAGLNEGDGSLVFAEEILALKAQILDIRANRAETAPRLPINLEEDPPLNSTFGGD